MTTSTDETPDQPLGLLGVGVAHFQVIREFTWIPFGPLTLVFGPNSAGKSLIVDALDIAAHIWRGTSRDIDPRFGSYQLPDYHDLFVRSKRRERGPADQGHTVVEISARVSTRDATEFEPLMTELFPGFSRCLKQLEVAEVSGRNEWYEDPAANDPDELRELSLNGEPIYRCGEGGENFVAVNLRHPAFEFDKDETDEFEADCAQIGTLLDVQDGWVNLYDYELDRHDRLNLNATLWTRYERIERLVKFKALHDCLRVGLGGRLGEQSLAARVQASRTVPTPEQLTFVLSGWRFEVRPVPVASPGDPIYRRLAEGLLHRALGAEDQTSQVTVPMHQLPLGYGAGYPYEVADYVNHVLRDHLLIDNGYQFVADTAVVIPLHQVESGGVKELTKSTVDGLYKIVRVRVRDQHGREFDLTEIGSGIGYVLPILVAAVQSGTTIVEQPELHLHPALQSALGDVFVELASTGKRRLIVETHSEHLLLRILRRIRDSSRGRQLDGRSTIRPSDVEVIYFDPQPDGATTVSRLRITPEGDFFERWPRGFFEERDEDLLDE